MKSWRMVVDRCGDLAPRPSPGPGGSRGEGGSALCECEGRGPRLLPDEEAKGATATLGANHAAGQEGRDKARLLLLVTGLAGNSTAQMAVHLQAALRHQLRSLP